MSHFHASYRLPPKLIVKFIIYQLAKQSEKGYHKKFFGKEPDLDNIEVFWDDFCFELYGRTAPTSEEEESESTGADPGSGPVQKQA